MFLQGIVNPTKNHWCPLLEICQNDIIHCPSFRLFNDKTQTLLKDDVLFFCIFVLKAFWRQEMKQTSSVSNLWLPDLPEIKCIYGGSKFLHAKIQYFLWKSRIFVPYTFISTYRCTLFFECSGWLEDFRIEPRYIVFYFITLVKSLNLLRHHSFLNECRLILRLFWSRDVP